MGIRYSSHDEKEQYEDDDDIAEVCVTGKDQRLAICETKNQHDAITECIGSLRVYYNKQTIESKIVIGTGTIFHVDGNKCLVLTCAHNVRASVYQCENENCNVNIKMLTKTQNNECTKCNDNLVKDNQLHKPVRVTFVRRAISVDKFGTFQDEYECDMKELIINDDYSKCAHPTSGNDIAILVINDKKAADYYRDKCKKIFLVNNLELFENDKPQMNLFGYPGDKNKGQQMWGMSTPNPNNLFCGLNMQTLNLYLINKEMDTASGQNGSSIYCRGKDADIFWICSVHTGGSKCKNENYGTLLDHTKLTWIKDGLKKIDVHIPSEKIIEKETKYSALYIQLKEQINTLKKLNEDNMEQLQKQDETIKKHESTIANQQEAKKHVSRRSQCTLFSIVLLILLCITNIGWYWQRSDEINELSRNDITCSSINDSDISELNKCNDKYLDMHGIHMNCMNDKQKLEKEINKLNNDINELETKIDLNKCDEIQSKLNTCSGNNKKLKEELHKTSEKLCPEYIVKIDELEHELGECNVEWGQCEQLNRQKDVLIKKQKHKFELCNNILKRCID